MFERKDLIRHSSHIAFGSGMSFMFLFDSNKSQFRNELAKYIKPPKRSTFKIDDILGIRLITRIRLGFSQLREHIIVTIFLSVQSALVGLNPKQLNISSYTANASLKFSLICSTMDANWRRQMLIYYPTDY